MLNDSFVAEKKEAGTYAPLPVDIYTVELLDIIAVTEESYDSKQARAKDPSLAPVDETTLKFQFVLLEGKDGDTDLRGRNLFQNFVPSFLYISKKGKNKLYQIVEAMQAQTVSPEQEAFGITGKELNSFIGKQCRVGTVNKTEGDKTYTNIDKFLAVKDKYPALTAEEKESAKIKPKDGEQTTQSDILPVYGNEQISPEDIPFNQER